LLPEDDFPTSLIETWREHWSACCIPKSAFLLGHGQSIPDGDFDGQVQEDLELEEGVLHVLEVLNSFLLDWDEASEVSSVLVLLVGHNFREEVLSEHKTVDHNDWVQVASASGVDREEDHLVLVVVQSKEASYLEGLILQGVLDRKVSFQGLPFQGDHFQGLLQIQAYLVDQEHQAWSC
jgi:hypothetical protein